MLILPRYPGFDLPIHAPETLVAHRQNAFQHTFDNAIARASGSTIVRAIGITLWENDDFIHIGEVLDKTEKELTKASEHCGFDVIPHEWGLYPISDREPEAFTRYRPQGNNAKLLPEGYILVAEVGIVREAMALKIEDLQQLHAGLDQYYNIGEFQLFDLRRIGQAIRGRCDIGSEANKAPGIKFVDIEPHFRVTQ